MNRKAQELPMKTIVIIILVMIAIAVLLITIFTIGQTGKEQAEQQAGIGSTVADTANCRLWASGINTGFDCSEVACPEEIICEACGHYGLNKDETAYVVDGKGCILPDGTNFAGCTSCI